MVPLTMWTIHNRDGSAEAALNLETYLDPVRMFASGIYSDVVYHSTYLNVAAVRGHIKATLVALTSHHGVTGSDLEVM